MFDEKSTYAITGYDEKTWERRKLIVPGKKLAKAHSRFPEFSDWAIVTMTTGLQQPKWSEK